MHPDIFMSEPKELHFWCEDLRRESEEFHGNSRMFDVQTLNDYLSHFDSKESSKVRYRGESTVTYLLSEDAPKKLAEFSPQAKIIILLRDPLELAHSWYTYLRYRSEEPLESFEEALEVESDRKEGRAIIPSSVRFPRRIFYRELVDFAPQIRRYFEVFPPDQIHFLLQEDLRDDVGTELDRIFRFLDLTNDPPLVPEAGDRNVNVNVRFGRMKWFFDNLHPLRGMLRRAPLPVLKAVRRVYYSIVMSDGRRRGLSREQRENLQVSFADGVAQTSELVGVDLSSRWGYSGKRP